MGTITAKIYTPLLTLSIVALSWSLVWFAFVYYPKVINDYKTGSVLARPIIKPIAANSQKFPIETSAYKLVYEEGSQTYYAFIEGGALDTYAFNKDNARLALKTALSAQSLCDFNIIYISTKNLKIPQNLRDNTDC